jgi:hypothetical protein
MGNTMMNALKLSEKEKARLRRILEDAAFFAIEAVQPEPMGDESATAREAIRASRECRLMLDFMEAEGPGDHMELAPVIESVVIALTCARQLHERKMRMGV